MFSDCKLVGILFYKCEKLLLSFNFHNSILQFCDFNKLNLRKISFKESQLKNVDFSNADLSEANFYETDLLGTLFIRTNLGKTNFRKAKNYAIDPTINIIKKAKFSFPEVLNLLQNFDIEISWSNKE